MVMKSLIYNLRFGFVNIKTLSREEVLEVLDYYVPDDVIDLCYTEIARRRDDNLAKQEAEKTNRGAG